MRWSVISRSINSPSLVHTHEVVCLDGTDTASYSSLLFTTLSCTSLLLLSGEHLVLEVWLNAAWRDHWHLLLKLWVHWAALTIRIICALLDYIGGLGWGTALAKQGLSSLHLSIDQLDLFLYFLKHLREASLLEDWLRAEEVLFCLLRLWWIVNHVESADYFACLCNIDGAISVKCRLQFLKKNKIIVIRLSL